MFVYVFMSRRKPLVVLDMTLGTREKTIAAAAGTHFVSPDRVGIIGRGTGKCASLAYSRRMPPDLRVDTHTAGRSYCRDVLPAYINASGTVSSIHSPRYLLSLPFGA